MDPASRIEEMNRNQFDELIESEAVLEEVANRIFAVHSERNERINEQNPLAVKMETKISQVKTVLEQIDQGSFCELRDQKSTPGQLYSR